MKTNWIIRYLTLCLISSLLLSCSGNSGTGNPKVQDFFGSLDFNGRYIVVIDMDNCSSCHYKQILDLCKMDCPNTLLLIHSTNKSKNRILSRDCKNGPGGHLKISFFSDKDIMQAIGQDAEGSLFLVSKDLNNKVSIHQIVQINETIPYCD